MSETLDKKHIKILIIDNNPHDCLLYKQYLESVEYLDYTIVQTDSGSAGLSAFRQIRPDCLILDYALPDISGLELIKKLPELADHRCGIVMITAAGDEEVAVEAMKAGVHDYLVKGGFSRQALFRAIRNAIENVRLRGDLALKNLELRERNRELAEKNEELEKFAYVASHDLKQPLRTLKGYLDLVAGKFGSHSDAEMTGHLGIMYKCIARMSDLIDDLLKYAALGKDSKDFKRVESDLALGMAKMNLAAIIDEHNAEISAAPLPEVYGDLALLTQVFQNLLHNAITYRRETPPRVQISAVRQGDAHIFAVRDNGIGIAPENLTDIFQAFRRLHSYAEYPGSGLGLAAAKKAVQLHGGKIWAESRPGKGTTFYFSIPAKITAHPAKPAAETL